jgi:16S rRNA (cytosine1402-N4)-methyltransferase
MQNLQIHHVPAFEKTIIHHLQIQPGQVVIDGTCGEGGHAAIIAPCLGDSGLYIALDRDNAILEKAKERLLEFHRIHFFNHPYTMAGKALEALGIQKANCILLDLGLSMYHLKTPERGFSFLSDAPLDMRFNAQDSPVSALDVVNHFQESEISDILYTFGEERMSKQIAKRIVEKRKIKAITTCSALAHIIAGAKGWKQGSHPATKSFQALRIYVNAELYHLEEFLSKVHPWILSGGLLAVITYQSMEDRLLKNFSKESPYFSLRDKKPILPDDQELHDNASVRSAKLRVLLRA